MQYHHDFTYGVIKAYKPEKNFPIKTIVSTIEMASYGTSKYLVDVIQPALNKNNNLVINLSSSTHEAATWETTQEEIQVSHDVINLHPSVPMDKAVTVLIETLNNDLDDRNTRTKLLTDIDKVMVLCLSKSSFLYKNKTRLSENTGLIAQVNSFKSFSLPKIISPNLFGNSFFKTTSPKLFGNS